MTICLLQKISPKCQFPGMMHLWSLELRKGKLFYLLSASEILTDTDEELQIECVSAKEVILAKQPMASDVPDSEFTVYSPKRLSPAAPPFKPGVSIKGVEPTTVAVTPLKDGKTLVLPGLASHLPPLQVPSTVAVTPMCKSPHPLALIPQISYMTADPYHGPSIDMQGFVPPHQLRPFDGQTSLLGNGPCPGIHPQMYPFVPAPLKCSVQMNPNAREFIFLYLRNQLTQPVSPPALAVPVSPSSEMQTVSELAVAVAEYSENVEASSSEVKALEEEEEQVVDQNGLLEQSPESEGGVESPQVTETKRES
jgi:hypothetical protein